MSGPEYRRPPDVAWLEGDRADDAEFPGYVVYLARVPDGPIVVLEAPAAATWREAVEGPAAGIAPRVAESFGLAVDDVRQDVVAFLDELVAAGLLLPPAGDGGPG